MIAQNASRSTPLGMVTPGPLTGVAIERPNWPVVDTSSPWQPSVTILTANRSPPRSSNLRASWGYFEANDGLSVDKMTATASGSCKGGPVARPNTFSYVAAKKVSRACRICRMTVGGFDESLPPCRMRVCTAWDASTWCVRSNAAIVVFGARTGLLKMDSEDSGSHCRDRTG